MSVDVYYDGSCLNLLMEGKKVVHRGGVRVSEKTSSKKVLDELKQQAFDKGANAVIVTHQERIDGTLWVMAGNAVLIKDTE